MSSAPPGSFFTLRLAPGHSSSSLCVGARVSQKDSTRRATLRTLLKKHLNCSIRNFLNGSWKILYLENYEPSSVAPSPTRRGTTIEGLPRRVACYYLWMPMELSRMVMARAADRVLLGREHLQIHSHRPKMRLWSVWIVKSSRRSSRAVNSLRGTSRFSPSRCTKASLSKRRRESWASTWVGHDGYSVGLRGYFGRSCIGSSEELVQPWAGVASDGSAAPLLSADSLILQYGAQIANGLRGGGLCLF